MQEGIPVGGTHLLATVERRGLGGLGESLMAFLSGLYVPSGSAEALGEGEGSLSKGYGTGQNDRRAQNF